MSNEKSIRPLRASHIGQRRARSLGILFLRLQAAGALLWWCGLLAFPQWRLPFLAPGASDAALLSLGPGDLLFYIGGSLAAAHGLSRDRPWAWGVLCVHAGAAAYAALCAIALPLLSGGGAWLGALLMAPSLVIPLTLAYALRPRPAPLGGD